MSSIRRPKGAVIPVAIALSLLVAACTPPRSRNTGFNGYATDIVLGAQSRPTNPPLPPTPGASPNPGFPSFLVPPPPLPGPPGAPIPSTVPQKPLVVRCPQAGVDVIPPEAGIAITKPPVAGVYPYSQKGTWKRPDGQTVEFPPEVARTLQNVLTDPTGAYTYDVVTTQLGETTTMSYRTQRAGDPNSDGIYLTRQVVVRADKTTKEAFEPTPPGLRMFPLPPGVGTTFRSTATDGVRSTAMVLSGAVREKTRIDACGELVEGWGTQATIHVLKSGITSGRTTKYQAFYVVVPQLGGLIVAEKLEVLTTESQDPVLAEKPTTPASTQPTTATTAAPLPATQPAVTTPPTTLPPRSPDERQVLIETNIEKLTPLKATK